MLLSFDKPNIKNLGFFFQSLIWLSSLTNDYIILKTTIFLKKKKRKLNIQIKFYIYLCFENDV